MSAAAMDVGRRVTGSRTYIDIFKMALPAIRDAVDVERAKQRTVAQSDLRRRHCAPMREELHIVAERREALPQQRNGV